MTVQEHSGSSLPVSGVVYLLFFASGASGLIYQVVWVREFGNVFGNTVYSASLVFAVFMLGLGFGSYVIGRWADRPSLAQGATLLRFYGYLELAARLKAAPAVQEDLDRVALGQLIEIIGSFVAPADTLEQASRPAGAESDNRPLQEYVARSRIGSGTGMPRDIFDVEQVAAWCPGCFVGGRPVTLVEGLDRYLAVLGRVYLDQTFRGQGLRVAGDTNVRRAIDGSNYLRGLVARSEQRYREQRQTPPSVAVPR